MLLDFPTIFYYDCKLYSDPIGREVKAKFWPHEQNGERALPGISTIFKVQSE